MTDLIKTEDELFQSVKDLVSSYLDGQNQQKEIPLRINTATEIDGLDLHMGEPSPQQLAKINQLTGETWDASDWFVCAWHASDNLVDRSRERWHLNILQQMAQKQTGRVLIKDHNSRQVDASVGFAFETMLILDSDPDPTIVNSIYGEYNQGIVEEMGLVRVIVWTAISSDSLVIDGLRKRSLDNHSTRGMIVDWKEYCPNCSKDHGRDIGFWELDGDGKYICPHLPPYWWLMMWYGDDPEVRFSDYVVNDGNYDPLELSIVQAGCLPAAKVLRGY
jgi:hypothetical protein